MTLVRPSQETDDIVKILTTGFYPRSAASGSLDHGNRISIRESAVLIVDYYEDKIKEAYERGREAR
jgi:hypothetical protein